ncbi:MAG: MFS transporter [Coriobacteriales bacterium]|jgi:EmrB/QacA subfamily drug resistance transporter|nr:MFS transporter [Coriobacteriales bacterium]
MRGQGKELEKGQKKGQGSEKELRLVQRTTLFTVMLASFAHPFTSSSLGIAIPFIGEELQASATSLSWIISAMMLTTVALSVPFGRLADLWGRRRIFNLGIFIVFVATLLGSFAPTLTILIMLRVLQGIGGAMVISTNMALLIDVFPAQERGRVLGLSTMCVYIGLSLGPVLGGLITHYFGWRAIFIATSGVILLAFIVAVISTLRLSKAASTPATKRADLSISPTSIALYIVAILSLMYGFTVFAQHVYSYILLGVGCALFIVFARHESRAAHPVIEVRLFKGNRNFIFSNLAALLNYAATFALGYILAIYLEVIKGYPADVAGLILITQPVLMAIISPIAGRLSDRWSPFKMSSVGMAICAVSMLSFLFLDITSPLIHVVVNLMIVGFGFGLFSSPNTNAVMSCVSPKDSGLANSMLNTMRSVGQVSSMAIITIVMHFTIGDALIEDASFSGIMKTFNTTFIIFAVLCAVGVLLSLNRRQQEKPSVPKR